MRKIEMQKDKGICEGFFGELFGNVGFFNDAYILPNKPIKLLIGYEAKELDVYLDEEGIKYLIDMFRHFTFGENAEKEEYKRIEDFAVRIPEYNFRVHLLKVGASRDYNAFILRRQFHYIPKPEQLKIPAPVVQTFISEVEKGNGGLILLVGKQRQGKSTTAASLLDEVNEKETDKVIVTVENPIEYILEPKKSVVIQKDVITYADEKVSSTEELIEKASRNALISAAREFPSVVLIGEIRTKFEVDMAVSLAESGVLVVGSFHGESVPKALVRFLNMATAGASSESERKLRRLQVVSMIRATVGQKLLPNRDNREKLELVTEYLIHNPSILEVKTLMNLLIQDKPFDFFLNFGRKKSQYVVSLPNALSEAVAEGRISKEDANAANPYAVSSVYAT